jgi:hypothetical protein
MQSQQQGVLLSPDFDERRAEQRSPLEIERLAGFASCKRVQMLLAAGQAPDAEIDRRLRQDHLSQFTTDHPENRAQRFVTRGDCLHGPAERGYIEYAVQLHEQRHVVGRTAGFQSDDQPQALLLERDGVVFSCRLPPQPLRLAAVDPLEQFDHLRLVAPELVEILLAKDTFGRVDAQPVVVLHPQPDVARAQFQEQRIQVDHSSVLSRSRVSSGASASECASHASDWR